MTLLLADGAAQERPYPPNSGLSVGTYKPAKCLRSRSQV